MILAPPSVSCWSLYPDRHYTPAVKRTVTHTVKLSSMIVAPLWSLCPDRHYTSAVKRSVTHTVKISAMIVAPLWSLYPDRHYTSAVKRISTLTMENLCHDCGTAFCLTLELVSRQTLYTHCQKNCSNLWHDAGARVTTVTRHRRLHHVVSGSPPPSQLTLSHQ